MGRITGLLVVTSGGVGTIAVGASVNSCTGGGIGASTGGTTTDGCTIDASIGAAVVVVGVSTELSKGAPVVDGMTGEVSTGEVTGVVIEIVGPGTGGLTVGTEIGGSKMGFCAGAWIVGLVRESIGVVLFIGIFGLCTLLGIEASGVGAEGNVGAPTGRAGAL